MQGNWTKCVPLKYLKLMPDIQKLTVLNLQLKFCPLPLEAPGGHFGAPSKFRPSPRFNSVYALPRIPLFYGFHRILYIMLIVDNLNILIQFS